MLLLIIELIVIVFGVWKIRKNFRQHFLLLYCLILYFIYLFIGPLNSVITNNYTKWECSFKDYFNEGVAIYIVALLSFIFVYLISFKLIKIRKKKNEMYSFNMRRAIFFILLFFILVLYVVLLRKDGSYFIYRDSLSYTGVFLTYLIFLSDSLLLAFSIVIYENKMKKWLWVLLITTCFFYLLLGFRYRIILLFIAISYKFFLSNRFNIKMIWKGAVLLFFIAWTLNFVSFNRYSFWTFQLQEVKMTFFSDMSSGDANKDAYFLKMTSNYGADFCALKYFKQGKGKYDYGSSMFLHPFIRFIPKNFFGGEKPKPPQLIVMENCFESTTGLGATDALTNIFEYYIAFGVFGVVFFMGLLGYILAYFSKTMDISITRNRVIIVMVALLLFQEITRGFLPHTITLLAFFLIPLLLFYKKSNRITAVALIKNNMQKF